MTTNAELRGLLVDCLEIWGLSGEVRAEAEGLRVTAGGAACTVTPGPPPTRWFIAAAGRRRPVPSIVALLSAVRRALGVPPGIRARVGAGAGLE